MVLLLCGGRSEPSFNVTTGWGIPAGGGEGILSDMAAYEYVCMACEHRFEERRPMTASVDTALACPNCGDERVRRQYSFVAGTSPVADGGPSAGGCGCGSCTCGG
jgi:putative FmdB family regulatory protein